MLALRIESRIESQSDILFISGLQRLLMSSVNFGQQFVTYFCISKTEINLHRSRRRCTAFKRDREISIDIYICSLFYAHSYKEL